MGLLDPSDDYERALDRGFATGPTQGAFERLLSAPGEAFRTQTSVGEILARRRAIEEQMETYRRLTGEQIQMPSGPMAIASGQVNSVSTKEKVVTDKIRELIEANPEHADQFNLDFDSRALELISSEDEEVQRIRENMDQGWGTSVADFVGTSLGLMADPFVLASLPVGGVGGGLLRTAAREAGIAAISESAIQAVVQDYRGRAGLEAGFSEGATNVAMATAGAAGLTLLGGGLAMGVRRGLEGRRQTLREREAAAAQDVVARRIEEDAGYPPGLNREETEFVRTNVDAFYGALLEGEPAPRIRSDVMETPAWIEQRLAPVERLTKADDVPVEYGRVIHSNDALARNYFHMTQAQARLNAVEELLGSGRLADVDAQHPLRRLSEIEKELAEVHSEALRFGEAETRLSQGQDIDPDLLRRVVDKELVERQAAIRDELSQPDIKPNRRAELLAEEQRIRESMMESGVEGLARRRRRAEGRAAKARIARRELLESADPEALAPLRQARQMTDETRQSLAPRRAQRRKQMMGDPQPQRTPREAQRATQAQDTPRRQQEVADAVRTDVETQEALKNIDQIEESQVVAAREYAEANPDMVIERVDGRATRTLADEWKEVDSLEQFVNEFTRCVRG